jgi:hypothetical protein
MDGNLIESITEATDVPLSPLASFWLKADNFAHRLRTSAQRRWEQSRLLRRQSSIGGVRGIRLPPRSLLWPNLTGSVPIEKTMGIVDVGSHPFHISRRSVRQFVLIFIGET